MKVLRDNKDSLMAVLEAFVYDPLLNWRLLETTAKANRSKARAVAGPGESVSASVQEHPGEFLEANNTLGSVTNTTIIKKGPPEEVGGM